MEPYYGCSRHRARWRSLRVGGRFVHFMWNDLYLSSYADLQKTHSEILILNSLISIWNFSLTEWNRKPKNRSNWWPISDGCSHSKLINTHIVRWTVGFTSEGVLTGRCNRLKKTSEGATQKRPLDRVNLTFSAHCSLPSLQVSFSWNRLS